jgi:hypothetical protein
MPICKLCSNSFPNRVILNGKIKVLSSRAYCLECSPWGQHNTARLEAVASVRTNEHGSMIIRCSSCDREYVYSRKAGHGRSTCNSCWNKKRKIEMKLKAVEYKGGKCCRCNYNKNIKALQFHHLDVQQKDFIIGGSYTRSWSILKTELDKCILVCANCHVEIHDEMDQDLPYSYNGVMPA